MPKPPRDPNWAFQAANELTRLSVRRAYLRPRLLRFIKQNREFLPTGSKAQHKARTGYLKDLLDWEVSHAVLTILVKEGEVVVTPSESFK